MLNKNDDNDVDDDSGFSNPEFDREETLACLDAAIILLAKEKPTFNVIKATELIIRAMNYTDRSYGERLDYEDNEALDFEDENHQEHGDTE